jgi:hypothetical protein
MSVRKCIITLCSVNKFTMSHISEYNSVPCVFLFITFLSIVYFVIFQETQIKFGQTQSAGWEKSVRVGK